MPDPEKAFLQKRVSVGAALASTATLVVFLLWRVAAIADAGLGSAGWLWLGFEAALVIFAVLPLAAVLYCALGVVLVHRGQGKRAHSAAAGGLVGALAGVVLGGMGVFDIEVGGALNSTLAGVLAMFVSGIAGGFLGHAGWFPHASIDE